MINLEFIMPPGEPSVMEYDVHPASQEIAIPIPDGAYGVVVWLGTREILNIYADEERPPPSS
jgi:hypothetical protein